MIAWLKQNKYLLIAALLSALLFSWPYLCRDLLGIEQDTFFHLSRIEGLAESLSRGNFFPEIYPYKNNGYGYASPSFYCDLFLIIPALLYLAGISLSICYKITVIAITFFTFYTMAKLLMRITRNQSASIIAASAYLFCNYRITDVYVRGAFGEVMAMIFLPVLLSALYEILQNRNSHAWFLLTLSLAGLIFSHNITFLFGAVLVILYALIFYKSMDHSQLMALVKGSVWAFLISAWFTLPMIEQMTSQQLTVSYYAAGSDLASYAMPLKQYLQNFTNFGQGGYALPEGQLMTLNAGVFLSIVPLFYFFLCKEKRNASLFIKSSFILGLIFYILPSDLIPWDLLSVFRVLQFPWRLLTLSTVLLCIPAAYVLCSLNFFQKKQVLVIISCLLAAEGIYHLAPAAKRTFGITSENTYADIIQGKIIDPYYSATYMRVELAGADYLPLGSPNFFKRSSAIRVNDKETDIPFIKKGTVLSFSVPESDAEETITLPITWYKGYQVYLVKNGIRTSVDSFSGVDRMVSFTAAEAGDYICAYKRTPLRIFSLILSAVSFAALLVMLYRTKKQLA